MAGGGGVLLSLLGGNEEVVDVLLGTTVGDDGVAEELVKFWVFLDGHEDASWNNPALLHLLGVVS